MTRQSSELSVAHQRIESLGALAVHGGRAPHMPALASDQRAALLDAWRSVLKRKWAVLALACVVGTVAGVVANGLAPVYQAETTVLIESGRVKVVSIDDVYSTSQQREHYQTQIEMLKSRGIAERAVRKLKLWEHPSFDPRQERPGLRTFALGLLGMRDSPTEWDKDSLEASAVAQVMGALSVVPVRGSQLVRVSFSTSDPDLAAAVANAIANEYIAADREERFRLTAQIGTFLQDRMSELRQKLSDSERALQSYRDQKGIVNLGGSAQAVTGKQVGDTSEQLVAARSRRVELESAYKQASATNSLSYAEIPAVMRDPAVAGTLQLLNGAKRALAGLQETLGSQHYKVVQAQAEVDQLQKLAIQQSTAVVSSLRREYEAALATETALEKSLGAAQGNVQAVNREEFQLGILEREVASYRQLYDMFMSRAKETDLARDVQAAVARVMDTAIAPSIPIRPNKGRIVLMSALLALLAGAIAALLIDRLDNTIKGGDDAEARLNLAVLTALPKVPDSERAQMARLFLDDSRSHYAEGIRTARTGVLLSSLDVPHKVLLITSTLPGEGKTTVAVNLAMAHAQTKRTLLIDADMRRAQAGKALGLSVGHKGLSNLVAGDATPEQCMVILKDTKLYVMPVGDLPPNPLELLLSQRFKDALQQLSEHFEMIIIDSPPVELVSEALVLAPMATSVAFVVKAMSTPAPLARKSITRIQRAGGNILGVVVNQLDFKHAQRYYGEYGASGYSYGSYGPYGTYGNADAETTAPAVQSTKARIRMKAGLPE